MDEQASGLASKGARDAVARDKEVALMNQHSKDLAVLQDSPYHLLKRAAQYAAGLYMNKAAKSGLTQRQLTVMLAIENADGLSQTELVKITGIDRSTLADMISRLAAQGYVQRRRTRNDARTNTVTLTTAGKTTLKNARPSASIVDAEILSAIPANRRKSFIACLKILASKIDAEKNGTPSLSDRTQRTAKPARQTPQR